VLDQSTEPLPTAGVSERLRGDIRFDAVSLRYPGRDVDALTDVSLNIPAGRRVAFVGASGSGKVQRWHFSRAFTPLSRAMY
jgi:ABC-type bacteriocin/lantibiotic exporter with double-glycine peptidase domain